MMVGGRSVSIQPPGFSIASIAGLKGWFKADAGTFQDTAMTTPAVADADPVGGWQDQSGTGNHLTQATGTKRPTLRLAIQNGRSAIKFDGVDDWLSKDPLVGSLSQPNTVFVAAQRAAGIGNYRIMDGSGTTRHLIDYNAGTDGLGIYAGVLINSGATAIGAGCRILTVQFNGASAIGRRNGAQIVTGNAGAQASGQWYVGSDSSVVFFKDYIFEFLFYNAALTAGEILGVEAYLNSRWAAF